jgi:RNA polymerase sigma-70 factor (ECF subfamily)
MGVDSFEDVIQPLYGVALRLAFAMLQNVAEAEDAVQDATIRAWRSLHRLRQGEDARPWFLAIVANRCRTRRRAARARLRELAWVRSEDRWPSWPEERGDLHRAIRALDPVSRLVLVLRYYCDLPYDDVAAISGLSTNTARARVSRAVRRLRADLTVSEVTV